MYALYAEGYLYADAYMRLYMLQFISLRLGGVGLVSLLIALKETRVVFTYSLINFLVTISLGLVLIPGLGVNGQIASITLGPLTGLSYGLWWVKKNLGITIDFTVASKTLLAAIAACLTTNVFVSMSNLNPWLTLLIDRAICMTVYVASVITLKVLNHRDIDNLENITTGLGPLSPPLTHVLRLLKQVT
ncbi:MAG: polysaccharide biosynthesis C-terminal domain-containing protein [Candidatus Bathyarchaeota archaeon]